MAKSNNGWIKGKDHVNGLLDKGCSFEGKIVFDGTVQINGDFSGEVFSEGTLVIGQDAKVAGNLHVETLICYGNLDGKVEAKNRIEIHIPSVVTADITTKSLSIEEGALFQGRCHMYHEGKELSDREESEVAEVHKGPSGTAVNGESAVTF